MLSAELNTMMQTLKEQVALAHASDLEREQARQGAMEDRLKYLTECKASALENISKSYDVLIEALQGDIENQKAHLELMQNG